MIEGIVRPAVGPKEQPIIRPLPEVHRLAREVVAHIVRGPVR
ncbi:hypothetical protein [Nocardia abscessus]|nr:hypothetical protein [Nocardia abscessus]